MIHSLEVYYAKPSKNELPFIDMFDVVIVFGSHERSG